MPVRILRRDPRHPLDLLEVLACQHQLHRLQIVVQLLGGAPRRDDTGDAWSVLEPRQAHPRRRAAMPAPHLDQRLDDVVGPLLVMHVGFWPIVALARTGRRLLPAPHLAGQQALPQRPPHQRGKALVECHRQ
ncbi:hypothetical protein D3C81_1407040 [compost metagenome]